MTFFVLCKVCHCHFLLGGLDVEVETSFSVTVVDWVDILLFDTQRRAG